MLNKTTSPKNDENRDYLDFLFRLLESWLLYFNSFIYQEEPLKQLRFLWFLHWTGLEVCPPLKAVKHCKGFNQKHLRWSLKKKKYISRKWEKRRQHSPVQCRPSLSAFRSALKRQPALWWLLSCWPAEENKITILMRFFSGTWSIIAKCFPMTLTSVFLSVITADHLLLGGKSRSTVYQLTAPLNLIRKQKI